MLLLLYNDGFKYKLSLSTFRFVTLTSVANSRSRQAGSDLRRAAKDYGYTVHAGRIGLEGQAQDHAGGDEGRGGGGLHRARVVIQKDFFERPNLTLTCDRAPK